MTVSELLTPLFITTSAGIVVGLVGLILRCIYKTKCDNIILCCGLLRFHRNVDDEMTLDMRAAGDSAKRRGSPGINNTSQYDLRLPSPANRNNV
jgi:hypothetical protein